MCASISRIYGCHRECKRRFQIKQWKTSVDCFDCLPVTASVDEGNLLLRRVTVHGPPLNGQDQAHPATKRSTTRASCLTLREHTWMGVACPSACVERSLQFTHQALPRVNMQTTRARGRRFRVVLQAPSEDTVFVAQLLRRVRRRRGHNSVRQ
ncbi:hypothetical protein HPB48_018591 [Haemaphysalis longicornis]|uniref:Uncharacterized protein n=1 Tax=Haemaphysalis longicornis TaxID=44386 RepID=A0A9J6FGF1_HAELO|nr:hypothetical protein HPB48_018591 [Haemaphysalis longicornis]